MPTLLHNWLRWEAEICGLQIVGEEHSHVRLIQFDNGLCQPTRMEVLSEILPITIVPGHDVFTQPDHFLKFITCTPGCLRNVHKILMSLIDGLDFCLCAAIINYLPLSKTPQVSHV